MRTTAEIDQEIEALKIKITELRNERKELIEKYEEWGCVDSTDIPPAEDHLC